MNRNKTFGNAKRYKDLGMCTLGCIGSVIFLRAIMITDVDAASHTVGVETAIEPTVIAQAVSNSLFYDGEDSAVWSAAGDLNGLQLAQVDTQAITQTEISDSGQAVLLSRTNELMALDNRDVDAVSMRLKEIIKGRYEADHLYIKTLAQVDELRQQLLSYEGLLSDAKERQEMLGAEKLNLQNDLDRVLFERDGEQNQIHALTNEIQTEKRLAIDDLSMQLEQMTAEREQAQARADSVTDLLAQKDNLLSDLKGQFDDLVAENELVRGEAANISGVLSDRENSLGEINAQLHRFSAERDSALEDVVSLTQMISEKDDALKTLSSEVSDLIAQRDTAVQEIAAVGGQLSEKSDSIAAFNSTLESMSAEKNNLSQQLAMYQGKFEKANQLANSLLKERDELTNTLSLSKSKADETNSALLSEQQKHSSSVANIAALEAGLNGLQEKFHSVNGERDLLLESKAELQSTSAELTYKVAALQDEILALNGELTDSQQQAEARLASANTSFEEQRLQLETELSDKDHMVGEMDRQLAGLQAEILNLNGELSNSRQDAQVQMAAANTGIEEQRVRFESELTDKDQSVVEMDNHLAELKAEMLKRRGEWEAQVAEQDIQILAMKSNLAALETERDQINSLKSQGDLNAKKLQQQLNGLSAELSASGKKLKSVTTDAESQLTKLKGQIVELETTGVSAEEQLEKLSGLNKGMDGQLSSMRVQLAGVNDENARNVKKLQAQIKTINTANAAKESTEAEFEKLKLSLIDYKSNLKKATQRLRNMELTQQAEIAAKKAELERAEALSNALADEMENAKLESIKVLAARDDNAIPIILGNADFFAQGSAELTKQGAINLARLASIVGTYSDRRIVVEGHTDSVPISTRLQARFESNWELSVARAATAVRHMQFESKIDPQNLSAAGFGEYKPVATNDTPEGRQQNRRVEVLLYPREREFTNVSSFDE